MKTEDLFNKFLVEIANQVSQNAYTIWFSKLEIVSITNNLITIKVPMEIHKKMLGETYSSLIKDTFFAITGINYDFQFCLEEELTKKEVLNEDNDLTATIENNKPNIIWNTNLNPNYTFENYVVGNTNKLAYVSAKAVAESPGVINNPLFIYGRSGLGKTHLMQAIGNYITQHTDLKVLYCRSDEFMSDYTKIASLDKGTNTMNYANEFKNKYRNVDVLIIDDIQFLVGAEKTQTEFFHTFEALYNANKQIIISSDKSPDDLKKIEERLRSRLRWGLPVDIYPPDFELRCDIIKEKIKHTSIDGKLGEDVIEFIANSCVNDVRHIEGTIRRLLAYTAMMVPSKITLEFAKEALSDYVDTNIYVNNSIASIQKAVADYFQITVEDIKSKKRTAKVVKPRDIAMYLCRMETEETLMKIGFEFGGRDHSTVTLASNRIEKQLKTDENLNNLLKEIRNKLK